MKLQIVADTKPKQYFCKRCQVASNTLYVVEKGKHYCPKCVPMEYKHLTRVNQNREEI